jgi:hypothetical protein
MAFVVLQGFEAMASLETAEARTSGAEEAAEKGLFESKCRLKVLQGLKPNIDLIGFIGPRPRPRGFPGTPVGPVTKHLKSIAATGFSAACEARILSLGL